MQTKFRAGVLYIVLLSVGLTGCGKGADTSASGSAPASQPQTPEGEIRTAIQAHLAHKGNLNLQSFDTEVKQVTIQGDHAQAQVEFRVKNGPGAMELTYQLEKRDEVWSVVESNPDGSNFSHPPLNQGQSPAMGGPIVGHSLSDSLRSFKSSSAARQQSLPPGHPPISSASNSPAQ
jgi:hypothetical protein